MNQDLIDNRHIRLFISSTFRDMKDERSYLMTQTFPLLRKLAAERNVTLTELDLRWGITEDEAKNGKVVGYLPERGRKLNSVLYWYYRK